jgi:hypothetical protein
MIPNSNRGNAPSPYGSLNVLAVQTKGNMDFPVVVVADEDGHIAHDAYAVQNTTVSALANNKHHLTIWNGANSGYKISLLEVRAEKDWTAVTGVAWLLDMKRITSDNAGGTALTPQPYATTQAALPSSIRVTNNGSNATETTTLRRFPLHSEETNVAASLKEMAPIWQANGNTSIVLLPGQGITFKQATNTTAGNYYFAVLFAVDLLN